MALTISPLSTGIGVELGGIDIREPLDAETVAAIRNAWYHHGVILIRQQPLTHQQHIDFSRLFGPLDKHDIIARLRHPEYHEILPVTVQEEGGRKLVVGRQWHSDMTGQLDPPAGSLLRCEVIPPIGGDTMFANMYLAYEALSDTYKTMLEGKWGIHDLRIAKHNRGQDPKVVYDRTPPIAHPLVRTHPETGRKSLFISEMTSAGIVGMTDEESRPILEFLFRHATQPEFTYRHRWSVGDLIGWDNRCTQHLALADYEFGTPRRLFRTTLLGEKIGYVLGPNDVPQFTYDPRA